MQKKEKSTYVLMVNLPKSIIRLILKQELAASPRAACRDVLYKELEHIFPDKQIRLENIHLVLPERLDYAEKESIAMTINEEANRRLEEIKGYAMMSKKNLAEILICQEMVREVIESDGGILHCKQNI